MKLESILESILETVANYYSVPVSDLKGSLRKKQLVKARHVYFYLSGLKTDETVLKIGKLINNDHSTVLHGKLKIANQLPYYKDLQQEIEHLTNSIYPNSDIAIEHCDLVKLSMNYTNSFINN